MSLRRNILANYVSQIYVTLIGIVMVPMYVKHMGVEAYGLVGFFAMMQAWFQLLDLGLSPTFSRAAARFRGGAISASELRSLIRFFEKLFLVIAVLGAALIAALSGPAARDWLKTESLGYEQVRNSLLLISLIVPLRWVSGFYRGAINGFEEQVWLSGFNALISSLRFIGVIPVLAFISPAPVSFFLYQLVVAVIETGLVLRKAYGLMHNPCLPSKEGGGFRELKKTIKFSLSIAFTSSVWIVVTQSDKLILSKLLPLAEYGYFTLAVLAAGGVIMICAPISQAIIPRLTKLAAEYREDEFLSLYRTATHIICVVSLPIALTLGLFSDQVIVAWTGNYELTRHAAPILALYALGNGVLNISALPSYIQYAKGDLRLHLIGNVIFIVFFVPALILATRRYGSIGSGLTWLIANATYFFIWVPVVHCRFFSGFHLKWVVRDVGVIVSLSLVVCGLLRVFIVWPADRAGTTALLVVVALTIFISSILASSVSRAHLVRQIAMFRVSR